MESRILIVDDNPFPTRNIGHCLHEKLHAHYQLAETTLVENKQKIATFYDELEAAYSSKSPRAALDNSLHLGLGETASITIFNYNTLQSPTENQQVILEIIKDKRINVFWTDNGYSLTEVSRKCPTEFEHLGEFPESLYGSADGYDSTSLELFKNPEILNELEKNEIRQVAIYTFNPSLLERDAENTRLGIANLFTQDKLADNNVFFLETSSVFKLFESEHFLSDGARGDKFFGTIYAYRKYGRLISNILFDLFLNIDRNHKGPNARYNYFKDSNRGLQTFIKLLNLKLEPADFEISTVSFMSEVGGIKEFVIDFPYKEYYECIDNLIFEDNNPFAEILNTPDDEDGNKIESWVYYCYSKQEDQFYLNEFLTHKNLSNPESEAKVKYFLPLIHSALFYEPDFYDGSGTESNCSRQVIFCDRTTESDQPRESNCTELVYLIKKASFNGVNGILYLTYQRRKLNKDGFTVEEEVEKLWAEKFPLIEPKVEESLIPLLNGQIINQSRKAAIAQYMNRNLSHNIGSHSIPEFTAKLTKWKEEEKQLPDNLDYLEGAIGFNEYLQGRMEFLAEFSSMSFSNIFVEKDIKDVCGDLKKSIKKGFEIIFLGMVDSYSGDDENVPISKINVAWVPDKNCTVDFRGDNLGLQAFYLIVENFIRNIYKHRKSVIVADERWIDFSIKTSDIEPGLLTVDIYDRHGTHNGGLKHALKRVEEINGLLTKSILSETYDLRDTGLGLLEMKSAALYLSEIPIEHIDQLPEDGSNWMIRIGDRKLPFPIFAAVFDQNGNISPEHGEGNIGFRFHLPKSKFCMINHESKADLLDYGIEFCKEFRQSSRHKFLIDIDNSKSKPFVENHRYVTISSNELELISGVSRNIPEFRKVVWQKYVSNTFDDTHRLDLKFAEDNSKPTKIKIEERENQIVFDLHGDCIDIDFSNGRIKNSKIFNKTDLFDESNPRFYFYQSFPSSSKSYCSAPFDEPLRTMLIEAACVSVSLFDERIQAAAYGQNRRQKNLQNIDILRAAKVTIPLIDDINLNRISGDDKEEQIEKLNKHIRYRSHIDNYIVIHLTLVETLVSSKRTKDIFEWQKSVLGQASAKIVYCSGRGQPANLPKKSLFVNYSTLSYWILRDFSKLQLVNLLKALRSS